MTSPASAARFVALDVHKHYVMIAAVDAQQNTVLSPRRVALESFDAWIRQHLQPTDAVVLEATTNAWDFHDRLQPWVASVTVAHPLLVKLISSARVKTDQRDTVHLARLLAAGLIPAVWVPSQEVRELRALVAHRARLVRQRAQAYNRLQSVLHRHNVLPPEGFVFALCHRAWWLALPLSSSEKLRVSQDLTLVDTFRPLICEVESELARLSTVEPWAAQVPFLVQLPGIGLRSAMVLLSAIGDIRRFPSAKQLVGYSGLGASVHASGQSYRTGGITKQGRREIRATLVEAAWKAVEHHPHWQAQFQRLTARMEKSKAIVAIARKLLVVIWHVLTEQVADRQADVAAVGRKLAVWGSRHHTATRQGLSVAEFVRGQLDQLQLGEELEVLTHGGRPLKLPSPQSASATS